MPSHSLVPRRAYLAGCGLVLLAGLILSLGVLCIRGATASDALQYLLWRSVGFTIAVAIVEIGRAHV